MLCSVCGHEGSNFLFEEVISDKLAYDWKLPDKERHKQNKKESDFCPLCHNSTRTRLLASAMMQAKPMENSKTLKEWVKNAAKVDFSLLEINICGNMHPFLRNLPKLKASDYNPGGWKRRLQYYFSGIGFQDITALTYESGMFDMVIHSEVLEHVYDVDKALSECKRVLKPDGVCLFTVPILLFRKTKKRAEIRNGKTYNILLPSYHGTTDVSDYLVYWEFGKDFMANYSIDIFKNDKLSSTYVFKMEK